MRRKKRLVEKDACYCFYILIKTIKELKMTGIAHRDIKAENILVNDQYDQVKLIDFGFSRKFKPGKLMTTAMGSPHYSAPEVLAKEHYDPIKADIWSAGVVLYFMLCGMQYHKQGYLPFFDENISNLYSKIIFGELVIPQNLNKQAADLLQKVLQTSPRDRPSLDEILYEYVNTGSTSG